MFARPTDRALVTALILASALACSGAEAPMVVTDEAASSAAVAGGVAAKADAVAGFAMGAMERSRVAAPTAAQTPRSPSGSAADSVSTMLIREGQVAIRVDSLDPAMDALRRLAGRLGGAVGNVSISAGDYVVRSATLELRIPAARFDEAMGGLAPIGKVEHSAVTAQDVGEEYVDLRARVTNARRLETRLVDLLATRTGKLEDVLAVERELARVREEIERHEGRIRWLGSRVATSTISVTVSERAPVVGATPGRSVIGEAFVQAWRNFVGLVAGLIASLGVLVPAVLVLALALRWWRGRRPAADR